MLVVRGVVYAQSPSQPEEHAESQPTSSSTSQPAESLPTESPEQKSSEQKRLSWLPKLRAQVQPAIAQLGDPISIAITTTHPKGVSVNLPAQLKLDPFIELERSHQVSTKKEGDVEDTFRLKVTAYDLGELHLPVIELTVLGPSGQMETLRTEPMTILFKSLLGNEPDPKLKGLEPPVSVYQRAWWLIYTLIGLGVVAFIAGITVLMYRHIQRRRSLQKPIVPAIPAHRLALERLAQLRVEEFLANGQFKELYLLLSEITRQYLGGRWHFDALEMTTTEISERLSRHAVPIEIRLRFERYLNECDLVKFAKYRPDDNDAKQAVTACEQLVRDTMPHENIDDARS